MCCHARSCLTQMSLFMNQSIITSWYFLDWYLWSDSTVLIAIHWHLPCELVIFYTSLTIPEDILLFFFFPPRNFTYKRSTLISSLVPIFLHKNKVFLLGTYLESDFLGCGYAHFVLAGHCKFHFNFALRLPLQPAGEDNSHILRILFL